MTGLVKRLAGQVPEADYELVKATDPATGIVEALGRHEDAIVAMSTHGKGGGRGALGGVASKVVSRSPRATLVVRPG